jgi:glycosyl transferase family 25
MKVYVINMERSKARRQGIESQLKRFGLNYEIVSAVDGKQMSDEQLNKIIEIPGEFTKSQAGCMLSHCRIYEKMQTSKDEYALILEDDVLITEKKFNELLENISNYANREHITLLTYYWCRKDSLQLKKIDEGQQLKGYNETYALCKPSEIHGIGRAAAYILSKDTAKKILDFHNPVLICQADSWIVYYERGIISGVDCIYPMPVTENPQFGSEIGYTKNKIEAFGKKLIDKALNMNLPIISTVIRNKRINFAKNYKNIVLQD